MSTQGPWGDAPPGGGSGWGTPPASDLGDAPGPPPPPWERPRRRRLGIVVIVLLLLAALPVGALLLRDGGTGSAADDDRPPAETPAPEAEGEAPGDPAPVDPTGLSGADATYARLLNDIDASERAMLRFQQEATLALAEHAGEDPEALTAAIARAAARGQDDLGTVRASLQEDLDDEGARSVRDRYVRHLDAWVDYLEAVEEEPALLAGDPRGEAHHLEIDTTGDAFARELRAELPDKVDADVRALAEGILRRGFPDGAGGNGDTV